MASLRFWRRPSKYSVVLFLGVAAVSVIALVWMGWRLLQQDRALEAQRLEEKREAVADRFTAALEKVLSEEERKLADVTISEFTPASEDCFLINIGSEDVRVWPEKALLYYPVMPHGREASSRQFMDAERAEFQEKDYGRAVNSILPFTRAEEPTTRVGAYLRLARNLRKAGRIGEALDAYGELEKFSGHGISIFGVPADLVARRARCVLLEKLENWEQLRQEAQNLRDDLLDSRWRLDRASFIYFSGQLEEWLGKEFDSAPEKKAVADAVILLWQKWQSLGNLEQETSGRESYRIHNTSVAVLWRFSESRLAAVIAGPDYQLSQWLDPLLGGPEFGGVIASLRDSEGSMVYGNEAAEGIPVTTRLASSTGLPWDVTIVNSNLEADMNQFAQRRRLMLIGLGMLALLVIATSYLIGRAVSRELAAARLQSDFVSAVSHEFRTPLTSMRQFTEMLVEEENLSSEKRRSYHKAQERATRRLSRLVESLLDFGRMEAGAHPYRLEPLDVGRLVKGVVEEFKEEVNSNDLIVEVSVPNEGPVVNGDRDALTQALWNLLDNAVKYSDEKPIVRVEVEKGNKVSIRVQDQGHGISSSEKSHIFEKFVRGSSAKMSGIKGTGIGLAMVKHIVDAHRGEILIESELGKGSSFTILLPVGG